MEAIKISKSAEKYLQELLQKQDSDTVGIKVFVSEPGSPRAETCIAYSKEDDDITEYELFTDYSFSLYQEKKSLTFLEKAVVDYSPDKFGGTLTIKAPNAKVPSIGEDASLEERVNYLLYSEINPSLAAHGGEVSLVEIVNKETAVLQFGGGCQGCGMVDVTLKDGIEKTLIEEIPELKGIADVTDHSYRENAYYK
tara:strand:+ start:44 stop:631 length:588 start_codon:yes stop_codon:yes gene_type:complete